MRKTARKTTSNAVTQTTIDEFFHKDNADNDGTKSKRFKDDKHALMTASMDNEKPAPLPRRGKNFKSILTNTVTTQRGISSLLQSFTRQCVNEIGGTRLMDTLPRQQCAQTNGFHYHQIHITSQKPRIIRARSIPMHLQRQPEPEAMTSQRRST